MLELDFSKKDFLLIFFHQRKTTLLFYTDTQRLTLHACVILFFCSPRSPLSSAGTVDPYIDASREKNLFLPALDVQIGEKSTYTQHAQRRTTHTHTHRTNGNSIPERTAGFHFQPCTIVQLALGWSSFHIKFDQKGRQRKSWIVTKNDE